MAKMKTHAVEIEVTVKRTLFVDSRRPGGAIEALSTKEGWADATRYDDDNLLFGLTLNSDNVRVLKVREVN